MLRLRIFFVASIILFGPQAKLVLAQSYDVVGVSVSKPWDAVVRPDEGIELEGQIRVNGGAEDINFPIEISANVDIGYWFSEKQIDPFTGNPIATMRFVIVRRIFVSSTIPANSGFHAGAGVGYSYEKFVVANPHWQEDRIYHCIGKPKDSSDNEGTFAVGFVPSDKLWDIIKVIGQILGIG